MTATSHQLSSSFNPASLGYTDEYSLSTQRRNSILSLMLCNYTIETGNEKIPSSEGEN